MEQLLRGIVQVSNVAFTKIVCQEHIFNLLITEAVFPLKTVKSEGILPESILSQKRGKTSVLPD